MNYLSTRIAVRQFIEDNGLTKPIGSPCIYALPETDASWIHHQLIRVSRELKCELILSFSPVLHQDDQLKFVYLRRNFDEIAERMWITLEDPKSEIEWMSDYMPIKNNNETLETFKVEVVNLLSIKDQEFNNILPFDHGLAMEYSNYINDEPNFITTLCQTLFR